MPPIWKPFDKLVYDGWIDAIISEASDELNDWEIKFVESIRERLILGRELSQLQAEKLESIYAKHTK